MFGSDCCTYIPNNTAPDGSFTKAMGKLKNLREEVTKNAGADMHTWDWLNSLFGSWGQWLAKVGVIIGIVFVVVLLYCAFHQINAGQCCSQTDENHVGEADLTCR